MNTIFSRFARRPAKVATTASIQLLMLATAAAVIPVAAHAEYRCGTPERLTQEEQRACTLARQDSPDALIRFVNRTRNMYNLVVEDYISASDAKRWDRTAQAATKAAPALASLPGNPGEAPAAH